MKASMFWQTLLKPRLLCLLLLVLKITGLSSVDTGRSDPIQYKGMVGGNVSFYCPVDKTKKLTLLYFQKPSKPTVFLNGYYSTKPIKTTQNNTKLDLNKTIMYMFDLKLSDSGDYECYYMYANTNMVKPARVEMHLTVTALFSKPVITKTCDERNGYPLDCHVKCESHNGLPKKQIKWNVPGNSSRDLLKEARTDEVPSNAGLVNISSTAYFNCSVDNLTVSCSVDGFTSDNISVCPSKPPPDKPGPSIVHVAAGVVCTLVVVLSLVLYITLRKRETRPAVQPEAGNGHPDEVIAMNDSKAEIL
ncbi:butyrophilin subfamily 1 member A1 [Fundulus heteroclitus]|uniref:butyrophilin subfamily 1 member A1 n=1 Tax=Fundulus heteroclitus TaxID=8078 RepID=UPI00165A37EA|nr:butyrophilin subfamily 1 member A1 [Fundulus heteroclitus]